ncbi:MAG: exodeoxyribonuclease VII large subunit [Thermodesulfobacteriota bacterium]
MMHNATMTVSELTRKIKSLLEGRFQFVWLSGEISNFRIPASGHYYFTVKDAHAQISAVMFRGQNRNLKFMPEDGIQINGLGRISVYEPRGSYQIIFEHLEPGGVGALQIAFEQLKQKLENEGLFALDNKQVLPFLPHYIGLVTSPSGAVVHDVLRIANRRYPNVHIQIAGCKVQGDGAEHEICAAIELLNRQKDIEVIIVARGGGSLEDLQAFNAENVARTIYSSRIPVISAVGHETDYTIADFVADMRAPTPSAAAELVVPVKEDLKYNLSDLIRQLTGGLHRFIDHKRIHLTHATKKLKDPRKKIQDLRLHTDDLANRLVNNIHRQLQTERQHLHWHIQKLAIYSPANQCQQLKEQLNIICNNLLKYYINNLNDKAFNLREVSKALELLNPMAILSRGYSITRTIPDKTVVRDADYASQGQQLEILLGKGSLNVTVKNK